MTWLAYLFAIVSGALITFQAGSNSRLKEAINEPFVASIVNYIVGISAMMAFALARKTAVPAGEQFANAPWWAWAGGLFGVAYGLSSVLLAKQMGAATLMALVMTGQLVCSVLLDHYGWVGFDVHAAGLGRIIGCVLMVVGLFCIAKY